MQPIFCRQTLYSLHGQDSGFDFLIAVLICQWYLTLCMCWCNFPNLRTEISNALRTMVNSCNSWNIKMSPVSKIILVLMPTCEYFVYDSWSNIMIYFIHFSGEGSKGLEDFYGEQRQNYLFPVIPQKRFFCHCMLNKDIFHEAYLLFFARL